MDETPSIFDQTIELGRLLRTISDRDPEGSPSLNAVAVFREWVKVAGPVSTDSRYFTDVLDNYDAAGRSNRDLFDVFELLHPYVEIDQPESSPPRKAFVPLPLS